MERNMPTQFMKLGFEKRVLRKDGFYNLLLNGNQVGFNVDLRINYYRGLPLSAVQKIELTVDGDVIPESLCLAKLNGKFFRLDQLKEMYEEYWGIKEPMHLLVFNSGLPEGMHDVKVRIEYKSPYMEFAPGIYGMIDGSGEAEMEVGEGKELR